jgi:dTDP-glucose pyrophosphorylase/CBS domain-containing protein
MLKTDTRHELTKLSISPGATISEAIARLDAGGIGALAICAAGHKLCGILTDGDLRRAVIRGDSFQSSCQTIATRNPIVASLSMTRPHALRLMNKHDIDHLPVIDEEGVLQDILLRRDLVVQTDIETDASELLQMATILPSASIAEAMERLDKAGIGALVLTTADGILVGLLTDGDIRRAVLRGVSFEVPCEQIASLQPLTAAPSMGESEALELMVINDINHLPVVNASGYVTKLLLRRNVAHNNGTELSAVIMAGGYGKRLLPLTEQMPKPMLPVGNRPLLERTIQHLRRSGIRDISLTTHYLPECIAQYFGDGSAFGIRLNYIKEEHPLGTAGGLRLMKRPDNPFIVINGDIITGVPFQEMFNFHRKHRALLTVGVRKYDVEVPFGVVELDEVHVNEIREKPSFNYFINAGTYLLEPEAYDFIPSGCRFDMTDLIQSLITSGKVVVSFPIMEYWLDVGRHEDYVKAQEDVRDGVL